MRNTSSQIDVDLPIKVRYDCSKEGQFTVDVRHDDDELARVESDPDYRGKLDVERVRGFRRVMNLIRAVQNETELYQWKGGHFKRLEPPRSHQHSLRTNKQWRVIVEIETRAGPDNNVCAIKGIEDYH